MFLAGCYTGKHRPLQADVAELQKLLGFVDKYELVLRMSSKNDPFDLTVVEGLLVEDSLLRVEGEVQSGKERVAIVMVEEIPQNFEDYCIENIGIRLNPTIRPRFPEDRLIDIKVDCPAGSSINRVVTIDADESVPSGEARIELRAIMRHSPKEGMFCQTLILRNHKNTWKIQAAEF